jgi:peptidoglycan/LPS O-acetylase OafA/YrhL
MNTFGLSFLYLGFGIILIKFILDSDIYSILSRIFGKNIVHCISFIGVYSYSIYLWHMMVQSYILRMIANLIPFKINFRIMFCIYFLLSIIIGIAMAKIVEFKFLKIRDKYFPKRSYT